MSGNINLLAVLRHTDSYFILALSFKVPLAIMKSILEASKRQVHLMEGLSS